MPAATSRASTTAEPPGVSWAAICGRLHRERAVRLESARHREAPHPGRHCRRDKEPFFWGELAQQLLSRARAVQVEILVYARPRGVRSSPGKPSGCNPMMLAELV